MRALAAFLPTVAGHAWMADPPTRYPSMTTSLWFNEGCVPGCSNCTGVDCGYWTKPCCDTPAEPTITDPAQLTFNAFAAQNKYTPWRSPGLAPVVSPCGLAGGWFTANIANGQVAPPGVKQGKDGRDDDGPAATAPKTTWAAGSVQEVSWKIAANHGGGYAWRICPKSGGKVTEECFRSGHLKFVGDETYIDFGPTHPTAGGNRTAIKATTVSVGTTPAGAQWRKHPMPTCDGFAAGYHDVCKTYQKGFPPPPELPTWYGSGPQNACASYPEGWPANKSSAAVHEHCAPFFDFKITDKVQIPADLTPGDYMLSYRYDCEQTVQIWANCAELIITA